MNHTERLGWIHDWFKNHRAWFATWPECPLQLLEWRDQSGSGINLIKYVLHSKNGVLMVFGDLGEAVYQWHPGKGGTTWEFIADCNLDYFAEKCMASEHGRHYPEWDADTAVRKLEEHLKDTDPPLGAEDLAEVLRYAGNSNSNSYEWAEFITELIDADKLCHDDGEWAYGAGTIINLRCLGHLEGIKMAVAQRDKEKT